MINKKAQTVAFATFSPYKTYPWSLIWSFFSLTLAWTQTKGARQLRFLHTAHFSAVPPWKLKRAGLKGKTIQPGALLFISAYNGDAEVYFRGFSDELSGTLHNVWKCCVEWTKAKPFNELDTYIKKYQRQNLSFYNAYPVDCIGIRDRMVLRRQVDKLHALALSKATDDDFKAAFDRVTQTHWGNVEPTRDDL